MEGVGDVGAVGAVVWGGVVGVLSSFVCCCRQFIAVVSVLPSLVYSRRRWMLSPAP